MTLGLEKASFEIKVLVEIDKKVTSTLRKNRLKWNGETVEIIIDVLQSFNYSVHYKVLNAFDYKTSQKRKHVIFVRLSKNMKFQHCKPHKNILT